MELVVTCEITWGRTVRVWWAYFWRNILAIICATVLGGVAGLIIGFIMGALGASRDVQLDGGSRQWTHRLGSFGHSNAPDPRQELW